MGTSLEVRELTPDEYPQWRALVEASPAGSVYAIPEYLEVLAGCAGGSFVVRAVFKGEEMVGGIGLYQEERGRRAASAPRLLLFYNGPVLKRDTRRYPGRVQSRRLATLQALEDSLRKDGPGKMILRLRSPLADVRAFQEAGWQAKPAYTLVVPLDDLSALWGRMDRNARRMVERAQEEGLRLTEDDDFESFFGLHQEIHERKGAPLYLPEGPFRRYVTELRDRGLLRLYHARLRDGEVASSQLVLLSDHPVTHTVTAASAARHHRTGASPFLRWKVFEALSEEGYEANDLTSAGTGEVTRFKAQLGGDLEVCMEVSRTTRAYRWAGAPARVLRLGRRAARKLLRPFLARSRTRDGGAAEGPRSGGDGEDR